MKYTASKLTSKEKVEKALTVLLYILLLCSLGFLFLKDAFEQYSEGKTFFSQSTKFLTNADKPTLTICFEAQASFLRYGIHYYINQNIWNGFDYANKLQLREGENIFEDNNGLVSKLHLTLMNTTSWGWMTQYCQKITPKDDRTNQVIECEYSLNGGYCPSNTEVLEVVFPDMGSSGAGVEWAPEQIRLLFTTEANSYGVVFEHWLDGEVDPFIVKRGDSHALSIQVRDFEYIKTQCTDRSFYQCLSDEVRKDKSCQEHGEVCLGYTLPTDDDNFPYCHSTEATECSRDAIYSLYLDGLCRGYGNKRACSVQEYTVSDKVPPTTETTAPRFYFQYEFSLPRSSKGQWESAPFKVVSTELFVVTDLGLMGNVGGLLGLFIGFSIIGVFERIMEKCLQRF